jgi:hypothetical protein
MEHEPYSCSECGGPAFCVKVLRTFLHNLADWEKELLGEDVIKGIEYADKIISSPTLYGEEVK